MWINNYLSPIIKTIVIIIAQVAVSNDYICWAYERCYNLKNRLEYATKKNEVKR